MCSFFIFSGLGQWHKKLPGVTPLLSHEHGSHMRERSRTGRGSRRWYHLVNSWMDHPGQCYFSSQMQTSCFLSISNPMLCVCLCYLSQHNILTLFLRKHEYCHIYLVLWHFRDCCLCLTMYNILQYFTNIWQWCIELNKGDSKDNYNVSKYFCFKWMLLFLAFYLSKNPEQYV